MTVVSLEVKVLILLYRTHFSYTGSQTFNSRQLKSWSRWFNHHAIKCLWGRWKSSSVDHFCCVIRFHLSGPRWKFPLTLPNSVAAHILRHLGHIVTFPPRPRVRSPGRAAPLMWNSSSCFSFTCGSSLETKSTCGPDIGHYILVCCAITSKAAKISSCPGSAADKMLRLMALRLDATEINLKYQHVSWRPPFLP